MNYEQEAYLQELDIGHCAGLSVTERRDDNESCDAAFGNNGMLFRIGGVLHCSR